MPKGRVITSEEWLRGVKGYVGARKRTNTTAGLQAIVETLFFLLAHQS